MNTSSLPVRRLRHLALLVAAAALAPVLSAQSSNAPAPGVSATTLGPVVDLPPMVVATRNESDPTTIGSAVDLVGPSRSRQVDTLAGVLGSVPGSPVLPSGALGAATSLFLRGANSNQALFLVDGLRLNDPNTDYSVFLGGAALANDTVEIVRGPQSTLYGGEAIGGVVSIRSARGEGLPSFSAGAEGGSFGTVRGSLSALGGSGPWGYNLSLNGGHTDNERANNAFDTAGATARIDRTVGEKLSIGATARWFHGDFGDPGDRFTSDPDDSSREDNLLATLFANAKPAPGWSLRAVLGGQDRRFVSESSFGAPPPNQTSVTKNRRGLIDFQATFAGFRRHRITAGFAGEATHARSTGFGNINRRQTLAAFFAQEEFAPSESVHLTAGIRSDDFDTFGRATTGRLTAAWMAVPRQLKLRASGGTGFRSPSFLDLYGQSSFYVGNPSLRSERGRGWDAGFDYYLPTPGSPGAGGSLSATWFQTNYTDMIVGNFAVFPSTVANAADAQTRGLELSLKTSPARTWDARLAYTYLEAQNRTSHARLLRRPRHTFSADVSHDFGSGISAGAGLAAMADRMDIDAGTFATIKGEDYTVVRVYGAWRVNTHLSLTARLENALNEKYEAVNGYPSLGFGAFGGAEWTW